MMLNDLIKLKKFTPEEKEYSLPMALRLLDLSKVVALYGVLGLLDATLSDDNVFLRYGVSTPTKTVKAITTLMGDEYATALMSKIREDHNPDEELTEAEQAALLAD